MERLTVHILYIVTITLAAVIVTVVGAMVWGLFDTRVDNTEIFKIIGPSFQMIVGSFVGLLGGIAIGKKSNEPTGP